ncbi:hypothetical protein WJX64_14545 [Leifsonia sp. YIM 134122]|uniref:PBP domain-containing protein n=1 Tax=Leifsonia stereocauli TaxID=3134136 RepID=A0ABU9W6Z7_9MICO
MEKSVPEARRRPRSTWITSGSTGLITGLIVFGVVALSGIVVAPSAQADDSTAVTVSAADQDPDVANAPFPKLKLTVSQTTGLQSQGIELSWTGGKLSTVPSQQTGGTNFLQFAQCWGDDPENPGQPDRTTCQYGAYVSPGATRDGNRAEGSIADEDLTYTAPAAGFATPPYTSIPFRSATGETVASVVDSVKVPNAPDVNTNQFFTQLTSNEVSWAGSAANGKGSTKFEVQTVVQSPGLGCGSRVTAADGSVTGSSCWLVAIPRGTVDHGEGSISQSGLFYDAWKHKVAVRLDFRPVGINCAIGSAERQLAGSELLAGAVASWQPTLCGAEGGDAYTILTGSEGDAVLAANSPTPGPLALTSRPLSPDLDIEDDLAYAPVGLTGLAISFAIDREPKADESVPDAAAARVRVPFTSMNLTPRLLAKLLTSSYLDGLPYESDRSHLTHEVDGEPVANPRNILLDPDFLAVNDPEWAYQAIVAPSVSDLLVPQGRSDGAYALWSYIAADADAMAFLKGEPDPYGMTVNPWSSTDAAVNGNGVPFQLPRDNFPKSDPTEQAGEEGGQTAINLVTWRPYTNDLDQSGYLTLRGDGQILGGWDPAATPPKYAKSARSLPGVQRVIGVTDTASASKYQVVTAALRNPAGEFVQPTSESLTAASAAMTVNAAQAQVYSFDFASEQATGAKSAYPLAMPVYAAVNPAMTDAALRKSYATFIRYAATDGQEPGVELGQLPDGYAPLPEGWRAQALTAAGTIETGDVATPPTSAPAPPPAAAPAAVVAPSQNAPVAAATPPVATDPKATGASAAPLVGGETPDDPKIGVVASALPVSFLAGLAGAAAVPLIPRFRRRL